MATPRNPPVDDCHEEARTATHNLLPRAATVRAKHRQTAVVHDSRPPQYGNGYGYLTPSSDYAIDVAGQRVDDDLMELHGDDVEVDV